MNVRQMWFGFQIIIKYDGAALGSDEMVFRGNRELVTVVWAAMENKRTWVQVRWPRRSDFYLMNSNGPSSSFKNVRPIRVILQKMGTALLVIRMNNKTS